MRTEKDEEGERQDRRLLAPAVPADRRPRMILPPMILLKSGQQKCRPSAPAQSAIVPQ